MALTATTLSSACGATDNSIVVASATGFAAGYKVKIDDEEMEVSKAYVSGTTIPVLRGRGGSAQAAHVTTASVYVGTNDGVTNNWPDPPAGTLGTANMRIRPVVCVSYTGSTNTLTLPSPGCDLRVILNGTTADTLTIPVPTKDLDNCVMIISSNGVAQHVLTFTGGLSGAGTSYDQITINATAPASFQFIAIAGLWHEIVQPSGTLTNIAGVLG